MATSSVNVPIRLGAIAPQDAFAIFQARRLLLPSFRWQEVWQQEHTRGFAVAGVMRADVLAYLRDAVEFALANGQDQRDFVMAVKRGLVAKGFWGNVEVTDPGTGEIRTARFNEQRLRLIFDVNMRQSHAAGAWLRAMSSKVITHVIYRTMGDEKVRQSHRAWDALCLPKEHPFWDTHAPPNGWNCRCFLSFTNELGIERLQKAGDKLHFEAPPIQYVEFRNRSTGEVQRVPRGIDPGFAYNPGQLHVQSGTALQTQGLARLQQLRVQPGGAEGPQARGGRGGGDGTPPAAPTAVTLDPQGHALVRGAVAASRRDPAFVDYLRTPPKVRAGEPPIGMPVVALPPAPTAGATAAAEPPVAAISAQALVTEGSTLPRTVAAWAVAQSVVDYGQRLALDSAGTLVLWWWQRGDRIDALVLRRDALVWWVESFQRKLTVAQAVEQWPRLASVVKAVDSGGTP